MSSLSKEACGRILGIRERVLAVVLSRVLGGAASMVTGIRGWHHWESVLDELSSSLRLTLPSPNQQGLIREAPDGDEHISCPMHSVLFLVADKAGGLVSWGDWYHCCPLTGHSICPIPLPPGGADHSHGLLPPLFRLVPLGSPA